MAKYEGTTVVIMHKYAIECGDDVCIYASKKDGHAYLIAHDFSDAKTRCSRLTFFKNGNIDNITVSSDTSYLPEPLLYIKEYLYTLYWLRFRIKDVQNCVALDGLCSVYCMMAGFCVRIQNIAFWVIDVVPKNRFKSHIKDMIYKLVNKLAYQFSDEVWDLSPRMNDIREQELGIFKKNLKKHKLVPYGMWLERIVPVSYEDCEKETLVFMGHMLEKQGAQLVIQTLPFLAEKYPRIRLKLIGGGSYLSVLQKLAVDLGVSDRCIFMGKIPDIRDVEKEIARSCIAYAPYISSLDMWTKYADPGKVKTYLACGVPVILTDVPWNAKEICIKKCGMLVKEDLDDLIVKTMTLLDPKINTSYRINALNFAQSFSWNTLLGQTLHI